MITKEEKTIIIQKVHPSVSHGEKKLEEDRVQKASECCFVFFVVVFELTCRGTIIIMLYIKN